MKHWAKFGYYKKTLLCGLGPKSDDSTLQFSIHDRNSLTIFAKNCIKDI